MLAEIQDGGRDYDAVRSLGTFTSFTEVQFTYNKSHYFKHTVE